MRRILLLLGALLRISQAVLRISGYQSSFDGDPDVFLIGVQKGGTSSLTQLLVDDLKLFVTTCPDSEAHFFSLKFHDQEFYRYIEGFKSHRRMVGDRPSFDGSTTYFPSAEAFHRMKALFSPDSLRKKKFILSLREPISRDFSWFNHIYGECKRQNIGYCPHPGGYYFHDTFHDYVQRTFTSAQSPYGFYLQHLKDILAVIPRNQLFIYSFEMMTGEKGDDVLRRLLYFLGYSPDILKENRLPHENPRSKHYDGLVEKESVHKVLCSDIRFLNQTYAAANEGLVDFINSHPDRPVSEPPFPEFAERFSERCIDDDGSEIYLF